MPTSRSFLSNPRGTFPWVLGWETNLTFPHSKGTQILGKCLWVSVGSQGSAPGAKLLIHASWKYYTKADGIKVSVYRHPPACVIISIFFHYLSNLYSKATAKQLAKPQRNRVKGMADSLEASKKLKNRQNYSCIFSVEIQQIQIVKNNEKWIMKNSASTFEILGDGKLIP